MDNCTAKVKPSLVLYRRRPYPANPLASFSSMSGTSLHRRNLLKLWHRARQRHVVARVAWRAKLNRYLLP